FLGGAHEDGDHHNGQGESAGPRRELFAWPKQSGLDEQTHESVDEGADHDGRYAAEQFAEETYHRRETAGAILEHVDGGQQTDGQRQQRGQADEDAAAGDGVGQTAARLALRFREVDEEIPTQRSRAAVGDVTEYQEKRHAGEGQTQTEYAGHHTIDKRSPPPSAIRFPLSAFRVSLGRMVDGGRRTADDGRRATDAP